MAGEVSARDRARQARQALAKKRAERDRLIDGAVAGFFTADDAAVKAQVALEAAQVKAAREIAAADRQRARAVQTLADLGMSDTDMADVLGLAAKDVRTLRKTKLDDEQDGPQQPALTDTGADTRATA